MLRGTATRCSLKPEGKKVVDPPGDLCLPARPAGQGRGIPPALEMQTPQQTVRGRKAAVRGNKFITFFGSKSL